MYTHVKEKIKYIEDGMKICFCRHDNNRQRYYFLLMFFNEHSANITVSLIEPPAAADIRISRRISVRRKSAEKIRLA